MEGFQIELSEDEKKALLQTAYKSIEHGLEFNRPIKVNVKEYSPALQRNAAVFVTLTKNDNLRGCIGTLEATQPLISVVSYYAYAAAFNDPRFSPLTKEEFPFIKAEISILSQLEPVSWQTEEIALKEIRPGIDGLVLEESFGFRSTLLPSVWDQVSDAKEFLSILKRKAGLPEDYWSDTIRFKRYTAYKIS